MEEKGIELMVNPKMDLTIDIGFDNHEIVKYWDKDYINQQLDTIERIDHRLLFTTLWYTGVRITEALNIQKGNIDFTNYTITIRWQKHKKKGTNWQTRSIPLHPFLREMLIVYTAPLKANDKLWGFTRQNADNLAKKYFKGSCHMFRHSFAVNWLRNGGDLVLLSRMLGHSNVNTTMIYLQIVPMDIGKELIKIQFK